MDGLYKSSDTAPTTSTLTSAPVLVDGQYCVCYDAYWTRSRAFGVDLGSSDSVEWIRLYGKRNDSNTPVSWYPSANAFAVYKSDDNSAWTHVENFAMEAEDINPVSGSCAYWTLNFSESHTARYFKVLATGSSGAAWNSDGGSILVGQVIASSSTKPRVQFIITNRSSAPGLGRIMETGARVGLPGRSSDAGLEPIFSLRLILTARSNDAEGQFRYPGSMCLAGLARTGLATGEIQAPCRAQLLSMAGSPDAHFGLSLPITMQFQALLRNPPARLGQHEPASGQFITGLRSSLARSDPFFTGILAVTARSAAARASGLITTRIQLPITLRSFGRGIHHLHGRKRMLYHLVDQGRLLLDTGFTTTGRQKVVLRLTAGAGNRQRLVFSLSLGSNQSRQTIIPLLAVQNSLAGRQLIKTNLMDSDVQIIDPLDWDIFLDDASIKNRLIEPLVIVHDQAGIHNQLTLESADPDLFQAAQPGQDQNPHPLLVRIGTRDLSFILADRSGDQDRFTLTGLSPSILLDHPYGTEISFNQDYEVLEFRQGQYEITTGQTITGALSGATALVIGVSLLSGNWPQGTAQGRLYLDDLQGDFMEEEIQTGDKPNAAVTDGYLTTITLARSASDVARQMAGDLEWDSGLPDWVLPVDTQLEGYPIDIITRLAQAVGAVIRCRDDGQILLRPRFPIRPIHLPNHTPVAQYDRTLNLIQIDLKETSGTQYNTIEVNGYSEEITLPQFDFEPSQNKYFQPGEDLFARVYWTSDPPTQNLARHWTTAGDVEYLGRQVEQIEDESILLEQGRALLAKPILELEKVVWVGSKGWGLEWEPHSREVRLVGANEDDLSSLFRLAHITYTTQYDRYRVKNHQVSALIMALEIPSSPAVAVEVKYPAEKEYPAETIDSPLLTTLEAAVFRGQAELDRSSYHCQTVQLLVPYNPLVTDGVIVAINDDHLGIQGNFHVSQAQIQIHGPVILHYLECIQYLV